MRLSLFSVLLVLSVGVVFGFSYSNNAYAVTGVISDQTSCTTIIPGATWSAPNWCVPNNGVTVNAGETLTIASGILLNVQAPGITNYGTIENNGQLYYLGFDNHGTFNNHGQSQGQGYENFVNRAGGTITNDGTLTFTGSEQDINYGTIHNLPNGKMYQGYANRDVWNYNLFTNDGSMYLGYSNFRNLQGGLLVNNGQVQEGGQFNAFLNSGGNLTNNGNFTTINGYAKFYVGSSPTTGIVTNNGYMGVINQGGRYAHGFYIYSGTFTNNANGLIVNDNVVSNQLGASLTNNGVIRNECGSTYTGNEPTPNPTVHIVCPTVTISAPSSGSVGSPVHLTANVAGGLAPFSYNWFWILPPTGSNVVFSNSNSATTSFTPDVPGNYWLQVNVLDSEFQKQGTAAQLTIPITIAPVVKTPPVVTVTSPANGATLTSSTVTITGTASSSSNTISSVQVSIDGSAFSPANGTTSWSFTKHGLANGVHSVTAKATDSQGLIGYSTNVVATTPIPTGNGGQQVVFDSNNGNIYVANYNPTFNVAVVSGSTNQVLTTIPDAGGPTGIAFDPLNHYLYTADYNAGTVTVINDATNSVVGSPIPVGANPFGIIYVPNGDIYVANTGSNSVSVIDPSSNTVVSTITGLGNHPQDFTYDSTHHLLYMTNQGASEVTVINPVTNSVVGSPIPVGNNPRGLAYDPANGDIYVANNADSSVSIIDTTSNTVVSTLTGGFNSPTGVSLDPANGLVYVANFFGNTLSVIDTATNTIINPVNLPGSTYYYYEMFDPVNSDIYATSNGNLARVQTQTQFIVNSQVSTTTTLASLPNPSTFGQSVSFTATVTPSTATGNIVFTIDGTPQAPVPVSSGQAVLATSTLPVGTHTVTAAYSGDASNLSSSSTQLTQRVNQALTSVLLSSTVNPTTFGQSTTFVATINNTGTGSIIFKDGTTTLSTVPLTGNTASLPLSILTVGSHTITAVYSGDTSFAGAISNIVTQTINKIPTATTLASSASTVNSGQSVTLTATVNATVPNSETITFNDGATPIGTGTTTSGIATLSTTLSVGTHSITAVYPGDANYLSSTSSPVTVTVLSLLQEKQSVISSLQSLTAVNNDDKEHLKRAIEAIQDSVNPNLWQADGLHLSVKKGEQVFDDEKHAADQLREITDHKKESSSFVAALQSDINTLLDVDQKLAQNAISDANTVANGYTGDSKDVKQDIVEAQNMMNDATTDASKGHFGDAISEYGDAWSHAQDSIVDTTQKDNDDNDSKISSGEPANENNDVNH